jgi:supervillin
MLLEVTGRRHCQTRLVQPCKESINSNNAFILVTPNEIYNWIGKFSNVIVRSRSADVSQAILQSRDLCCKTAEKVFAIYEENSSVEDKAVKGFWKLLGCSKPPLEERSGPIHSDEASSNNFNLVWNVDYEKIKLNPLLDHWGGPMKQELLEDSSRVLVSLPPF